jgi:hypothetical protein
MYWYEGSIWQYGWVFPIIMIIFCFLMMVIMRGRCFPKRRSRQSSATEDDLEETSDLPPR